MSLRKPLIIWVSLASGVLLFAARTRADSTETSSGDSPVLMQPRLQNEAVIASEQVRRVYVKCGTNEFAFVIPHNFRVNAKDSEQLVFEAAEAGCFMVVRILPSSGEAFAPNQCRRRVLEEFPGAELLEQLDRSSVEGPITLFDLRRSTSLHNVERLRVAFMPVPAGILEVALHSKPDTFSKDQDSLNALLWSYQSNRSGRIAPIQAPAQPPAS